MPHDGPHDDHAPIEQAGDAPSYYEIKALALKELLIEQGVITAEEVRKTVEATDERTPKLGRKMVARAWVDPDYKARMLADGAAAAEEIGIDTMGIHLVVVENTAEVHNVVVCTLCSCYPRTVLGLPPEWYKSRPYRSRCVREPRTVLREFGTDIPDSREVRVHDSTADMRYLVLPQRPAGTDGWTEEQLARLVTRDSMVGVCEALGPEELSQAAE
ncbi:MAG: nitrile hydratase subunit alpha [Alphaproteobacteria bacterium]|nr:nitrile hydratase subunit alpha [Alphaproteobacteria bacterium]